MLNIEDLPADLFEDVLQRQYPWDAVLLATASELLMAKAAQSLAPWNRGLPFESHLWRLSDNDSWMLLCARDEFLAAAAEVIDSLLEFVVKCDASTSDDDLKKLLKLNWITELCVECRELLSVDTVAAVASALSARLTALRITCSPDVIDDELGFVMKLRGLRLLDLTGCAKLSGALFEQSFELPLLSEVVLENCQQLCNAALEHLTQLPALTSLSIAGCRSVTGEGLRFVANVPNITALDIGGSALAASKFTDDDIRCIAEGPISTSLTNLQMMRCASVTDASLKHLGKMLGLRKLWLACCDGITDEGLTHLAQLVQLTVLDLGCSNGFTSKGLRSVATLPLTELNLDFCDDLDQELAVQAIVKMGSLTSLGVRDCSWVDDEVLARLVAQLPRLNQITAGWRATEAGAAKLRRLGVAVL